MKNIIMNKKYALISGGSKGIGRAIAIKFAENNINIGTIGRDEENLNKTKTLVESHGVDCLVVKADLSKEEDINKAADQILNYSNKWDILVNNAAFAKQTPLLDLSLEEWDRTFSLNMRAILILSQKIVPGMIKQSHGKIINISSLGAFFGTQGMGAYGASKAALNQLTRTMAVEWGPHNIQTNAICPTVIMTDLGKSIWEKPENIEIKKSFLNKIPLGKFGEPEDVANLAYFLASDDSVFLNGQSIPLDGGKSVNP